MIVKISDKVLDYKGEPIKEQEVGENGMLRETGEFVTYKDVIHQALNSFAQDERGKVSDKDKRWSFKLSVRMVGEKEVEFDRPEVEYILKRVRKIQDSPLYVGRIEDFFAEKKENKKEEKKKDKKK